MVAAFAATGLGVSDLAVSGFAAGFGAAALGEVCDAGFATDAFEAPFAGAAIFAVTAFAGGAFAT